MRYEPIPPGLQTPFVRSSRPDTLRSSTRHFSKGSCCLPSCGLSGPALRTPNGFLTGLFMICYAIFRIVVEYFREPDAALIGMFTRGQFFSFFVIVLGIGFIVVARRRPTYPRKLAA